jgi:surface polysaccharide O-acyltransferase-like enzyme
MSVTVGGSTGGTAPAAAERAAARMLGAEESRRRPATRPRLASGDSLRAVAVIAVVVIHAGHWPSASTQERYDLWNAVILLARFSVPAFVVLTGMMLEYNRAPPSDGVRARDFLRRRAARSLVPWLAWAGIYAVLGLAVTGEVERSWPGVLSWLSYGGGHLYFLLLVPQLYLLFLAWPRGLRSQVVTAVAAAVVQTALCLYRLAGPVPDGLVKRLVDWHGAQEAPFWIGYFAAGVVLGHLARDGVRIRHRRYATIAGACLVAGGAILVLRTDPLTSDSLRSFESGTGAFLLPLMPVLVAGVVTLVLATGGPYLESHRRGEAAVALISRDALGIYILQSAFLYPLGSFLYPRLEASPATGVIAFAVLVSLALGLSTAATELLARTRLRFLVGAV